VGSNPALGLRGFQPPKQNYADDNDKQDNQLHLAFPIGLIMGPQHIHLMLTHPHGCIVGASEFIALYNRPFPRLRSLLCLAQHSFPLFVGIVPNALLRKDCVSDFELSMRFAIEAGCVPGAIKLLRWGFADWAKEGHGYAD
jgi:hypothetical protein